MKKHLFSRKKNIFAIIGAVFLSSATIAGSGTSLYYSYKNYSESSEFQKSYNLRFELDLDTTENPYQKVTTDEEQIKTKLEETAKHFALHLRNEYNKIFNVYTEYYRDNTNVLHAFLDVVVPNEKKTDPLDEDNKIDILRESIFEKYETAQRISILYSDKIDSYYDFTKDFLFEKDADIKLGDNKTQVNLKFRDDRHFDKIRETFTPVKPTTNADEYVPYMYILRDQSGLINHMNYILQLNKTAAGDRYRSSLFDELTTSEKAFFNDYYNDKSSSHDTFTNLKVKDPENLFAGLDSTATKEIVSGNALDPKWIEGAESTGRFIDHTGNVKYDFVKPYILGIVSKEAYSDDQQGLATFNKVFPLKNPTDAKKDAEDSWMVINSTSSSFSDNLKPDAERYSAIKLQKDLTSFYSGFPLLTHNSKASFDSIIGTETTLPPNINVLNPSFENNIFGNKPMMGAVICLAVLVLIVGILVSVLYRIPGLFGFLFMVLAMSLSILLITLSGFLISASLVCGLFIGLLIGFMTLVTCFQKAKKQVQKGMTILAAVKKSFAKSFALIFDLTVIVLISGIGLTYLAGTEFLSLGVLLILISLFSITFVYGGTFLVTFLIFWKTKIGVEPQHLMLRESFVKSCSLNTPNGAMSFGSESKIKKFNLFNKKVLIVIGSLMAAFLLVGIIVNFTIGNTNAVDFFVGSRIMIKSSVNIDDILARLNAWNYQAKGMNGDYIMLYSTMSVSFAEIKNALVGISYSSLNVAQSVSTSFKDYALATTGTVFSVIGMLTAYSFIRFGWVSIIPTFVLTALIPLFTILFFVMFQIYFDANIVIAVVIGFIIGCIMIFNALGNIFQGNFKKQTGSAAETIALLNTKIKNNALYFAAITAFGLLSTVLMSFLISTTIFSFSFIIFFAIIISLLFIFYGLPQMLILFVPIKNKYSRRVENNVVTKNNLDKIDEQLIDGINVELEKTL